MDSDTGVLKMDATLVAQAAHSQRLAAVPKRSAAISAARVRDDWLRGGRIERRDCAVRAMHMATRLTYDEAHALLKAHGRNDGYGTYYQTIAAALATLGIVPTPVKARTLGQLLATDAARGIWLIFVTGHFLATVDGRIVSDAWPTGSGVRKIEAFRCAD